MSLSRLKKLQKSINDLVTSYSNNNIIGPIPFLEDAAVSVEQAIEEYSFYEAELEEVDDDSL
jgi:hypothetical protein